MASTIRKLFLYTLLLLQFGRVYAQQGYTGNPLPLVQLGNVKTDNNMQLKTTKSQVMANPYITCKLADCEVKDFTITFAPKGEAIHGPFKTEGAKIKDEQLNFLKELRNPEIKIFIEDVHLKHKGKDITTQPLVLICVP